ANAYGCGAEQVSRALANAGCKTFFVATLDEAQVVRSAVPASAAIYVLDGYFQNSGETYAKINCRPVIGDLNELAEWDVFCRRAGWNGRLRRHLDGTAADQTGDRRGRLCRWLFPRRQRQ